MRFETFLANRFIFISLNALYNAYTDCYKNCDVISKNYPETSLSANIEKTIDIYTFTKAGIFVGYIQIEFRNIANAYCSIYYGDSPIASSCNFTSVKIITLPLVNTSSINNKILLHVSCTASNTIESGWLSGRLIYK